jgi:hypothetical protein
VLQQAVLKNPISIKNSANNTTVERNHGANVLLINLNNQNRVKDAHQAEGCLYMMLHVNKWKYKKSQVSSSLADILNIP